MEKIYFPKWTDEDCFIRGIVERGLDLSAEDSSFISKGFFVNHYYLSGYRGSFQIWTDLSSRLISHFVLLGEKKEIIRLEELLGKIYSENKLMEVKYHETPISA